MYTPKNFGLSEFFDPTTLQGLREFLPDNIIWRIFNSDVLITMDRIRDRYGKAIRVNMPDRGITLRGYRSKACTTGAKLSQHKEANAVDFDVIGMSSQEVRDDMKNNPNDAAFKLIQRVENKVNWVHIDFKPVPNRIYFFDP